MADPEVPKCLSTLPVELLGSVLNHIVDKGTMSALGRTSKAFYSIVMPRLYKRIYVEEARELRQDLDRHCYPDLPGMI
ncbi:hypothetical protein PG993_010586 [Apiospora rasikravindrae]|uniref:F-box domain-containing protein n=1 Tax=Apiospora rasikravindrae TaxID=990691 RepID=A0ABR1SMR9_9PEZI